MDFAELAYLLSYSELNDKIDTTVCLPVRIALHKDWQIRQWVQPSLQMFGFVQPIVTHD